MKRLYLGAIGLVTVTVLIQLAAAIVLDQAASRPGLPSLLSFAAIALAMALNLVRFWIWSRLHSRFPLSATYPLTAVFFPLILLVAYISGEQPTLAAAAGTLLITAGVALISLRSGGEDADATRS